VKTHHDYLISGHPDENQSSECVIAEKLLLSIFIAGDSGFVGVRTLASAHVLRLPTNSSEYFKWGRTFRLDDF